MHDNSDKLTPQERVILQLASQGLLDKEISVRLQISVNTLRTYWNRIRSKVGNQTRAKLAVDYVSRSHATEIDQVTVLEKRIAELEAQASIQQTRAAVIEVERLVVEESLEELGSDLKRAHMLRRLWVSFSEETSPEGMEPFFRWLAKLLFEVGGYSCIRLSLTVNPGEVFTFPEEFEGQDIFRGVLDLEQLCQQRLAAILHEIEEAERVALNPLQSGSFWPITIDGVGVGVLSVFSQDIVKLGPGDDVFFLDIASRLARVIAKERSSS